MPYQYKKLKGRIIEKYSSHKNFAKSLGKSTNSVSRKLNCKTGFSQKDIREWSSLLEIEKCLVTLVTDIEKWLKTR